jgi:hypothetical protein
MKMDKTRREQRIAELEAERRWHLAEVEYAEGAIRSHLANVRDIEDQLGAIKTEQPSTEASASALSEAVESHSSKA